MKTKPAASPTSPASYAGLVSRVCDRLGITPMGGPGVDKQRAEMQALEDWCQREQLRKRAEKDAAEVDGGLFG